MADRPTEARAYVAHNIAPPFQGAQHMLQSLWGWPYGPNRRSRSTGLIKPCPSLIRYNTIG